MSLSPGGGDHETGHVPLTKKMEDDEMPVRRARWGDFENEPSKPAAPRPKRDLVLQQQQQPPVVAPPPRPDPELAQHIGGAGGGGDLEGGRVAPRTHQVITSPAPCSDCSLALPSPSSFFCLPLILLFSTLLSTFSSSSLCTAHTPPHLPSNHLPSNHLLSCGSGEEPAYEESGGALEGRKFFQQ